MVNPELQPNTSNLQTLESEVALTRQEIEEFLELSEDEQEKHKDKKLNKLKDLQAKLDKSIQEAIRTGQLEDAQKLKSLLERGVSDLEEKFSIIDIPVSSTKDKEIFKKIRQFNFDLAFSLTTITDEIAEILARFKGELNLSGLKSISETSAANLAKHSGTLYLNGLKFISRDVAEQLARHNGNLWLDGLPHISSGVSEGLSKHKGELWLRGLKSLSDLGAENLAKHDGAVLINKAFEEKINKFRTK